MNTITVPLILVPFQENGYHILIKGKISQKSIYLLLDTGATETVFDNRLSAWFYTIDIERDETIESYGIQSEGFSATKAYIKTFRLNDVIIPHFPVQLIDMEHINRLYAQVTPYKITGLLGGDFFKNYHAIIDYSTKKLTIRPMNKKNK